jgi:hypothetical protein
MIDCLVFDALLYIFHTYSIQEQVQQYIHIIQIIVICDINYRVVLLLFKMCHLVYCANYILFFPFKRFPLNTDLPQMGQCVTRYFLCNVL